MEWQILMLNKFLSEGSPVKKDVSEIKHDAPWFFSSLIIAEL